MIPTSRHLEYVRGYIDLGMVEEESDELEAIDWGDRLKPGVLAVRVELYMAAGKVEGVRSCTLYCRRLFSLRFE